MVFSAPSMCQLNEDQVISSFWEGYSTSSTPYSRTREPAWLYHSINVSAPTTPLRQALLSLAYIRIGRLQNNQTLILKGQKIYGQTLRLMQNALYDPQLMRHDEILAAARCLVLYEAFESTSEDMAAWQSHIIGIARMIEIRGPERHRDPLPKSILESIRYNAMIVCLTRKAPSFFGYPNWLTQPWADTPKDLDQRLYDYGFALSDLIQRGEAIYRRSARTEVILILEQIRDGYVGMAALKKDLLEMHAEHDVFEGHALNEPPFGETTVAITSAILIALDLAFSVYAAALIEKYPADLFNEHHDLVAEICRYTDASRRRNLSKQVLRHLQYCLQTRFEYARPRLIFPLNVVRWELRTIPEDRAQIQALFEAISSSNQFRIARSVQNAGCSTLPSVVSGVATTARC
ncbi:uncharacterized protein A1O5_10620 [Cladophialophora psammophila CBS 110553]|uniref:Transcription factor domain-containing protein n=1 Tax=Cladophialophora psammophila CBS 110553 TaxID=1182543 RepID=W9WEX0_9EURO|nr:uncharacterized protein A1O5_10620 [Cladophialophora psammophila CBS 110553]EXJ66468.1 hypothetical protein A1O5_10620 [Cladophialophora psammophila CBS 110553]